MKKRILATALVLLLCLTMLPASAVAIAPVQPLSGTASDYRAIYDFCFYWGVQSGFLPYELQSKVDQPLTADALLSCLLGFAQSKCGVDVDNYLFKAQSMSGEVAAAGNSGGWYDMFGFLTKVTAVNDMLAQDFIPWESDGVVDVDQALFMLQRFAWSYIAPMSPCYFTESYLGVFDRHDFLDVDVVVFDDAILIPMINAIVGNSLGRGLVELQPSDTLTIGQFVAFLFEFAWMSLPKDTSGKYPGAISDDADTDAFVTEVLNEVIRADMNDMQKIRAVYDWLIYNCLHDNNYNLITYEYGHNPSNPVADSIMTARDIINHRRGVCDSFAAAFRLLVLRLGFECNHVNGYYVNSNGSKSGHGWNQIRIDGTWYWFDVDVEGTTYHRSGNNSPSYFLFMKQDKEWLTTHEWDRDSWPAADGSRQPVSGLSKFDNIFAPPSFWAEEYVLAACEAGLVPQFLRSSYTQTMTRAEFCSLAVALYETVTGTELTERESFIDTVNADVEKIAAIGVVKGVGGGRFDPNSELTREQAATLLARLADAIGKPLAQSTASFGDMDSVSEWAVDAVGQLHGAGVITGYEDNCFWPHLPFSREQSIVTVLRLYLCVR
ncbi:MAG: S-layer homology domain-containing protein [Oscillospiraceae bacterium]|nr:S-layer homology domain-containing protein [Oscillospiraceae bacterium]